MGASKEKLGRLGFQPVDGQTYCDNTKYIANILKVKYPMFFICIFELFVVAIPFGFGAYIAVVTVQVLVMKTLGKMNVPFHKLLFYLSERKSSIRRAKSKTKQAKWLSSTGKNKGGRV